MLTLILREVDGRVAMANDAPVTIVLSGIPNRDRLETGPELFVHKAERHHLNRLRSPGAALVEEIGVLADHVADWSGFTDRDFVALPCTRRAVVGVLALRPDFVRQVREALKRMSADGIFVYL